MAPALEKGKETKRSSTDLSARPAELFVEDLIRENRGQRAAAEALPVGGQARLLNRAQVNSSGFIGDTSRTSLHIVTKEGGIGPDEIAKEEQRRAIEASRARANKPPAIGRPVQNDLRRSVATSSSGEDHGEDDKRKRLPRTIRGATTIDESRPAAVTSEKGSFSRSSSTARRSASAHGEQPGGSEDVFSQIARGDGRTDKQRAQELLNIPTPGRKRSEPTQGTISGDQVRGSTPWSSTPVRALRGVPRHSEQESRGALPPRPAFEPDEEQLKELEAYQAALRRRRAHQVDLPGDQEQSLDGISSVEGGGDLLPQGGIPIQGADEDDVQPDEASIDMSRRIVAHAQGSRETYEADFAKLIARLKILDQENQDLKRKLSISEEALRQSQHDAAQLKSFIEGETNDGKQDALGVSDDSDEEEARPLSPKSEVQKLLDKTRQELYESKLENSRLREQNKNLEDLEGTVGQVDSENEALLKRLRDLSGENAELRAKVALMEVKLKQQESEAKNKLELFNSGKSALIADIQRKQAELEREKERHGLELEDVREKAREELDVAKRRILLLEGEIGQLKVVDHESIITDLRLQIKRLERERAALGKEYGERLVDLEDQLEQSRIEVSKMGLRGDSSPLEASFADQSLAQELAAVGEVIVDGHGNNLTADNEARNRVEALEGEIASLKASHLEAIAKLTAKQEVAEREYSEYQAVLASLARGIERSEEAVGIKGSANFADDANTKEKLSNLRDRLRVVNVKFTEKLEELKKLEEANREQITRAAVKEKESQDKLQKVEAEKKAAEERAGDLEAKLIEIQANTKATESEKDKLIAQIRQEKSAVDQQLEGVNKTLEKLNSEFAQSQKLVAQLSKERDKLAEEKKELSGQITQLRGEVAANNDTISQLRATIAERDDTILKQRQDYDQLNTVHQALVASNNDLVAQHRDLQAKHQALGGAMKQKERELLIKAQELEDKEQELGELRKAKEAVDTEIVKLKALEIQQEERIQDLDKQIGELNRTLADIGDGNDSAVQVLHREIDAKELARKAAEDAKNNIQARLDAVTADSDSKSRQIEQSERDLEQERVKVKAERELLKNKITELEGKVAQTEQALQEEKRLHAETKEKLRLAEVAKSEAQEQLRVVLDGQGEAGQRHQATLDELRRLKTQLAELLKPKEANDDIVAVEVDPRDEQIKAYKELEVRLSQLIREEIAKSQEFERQLEEERVKNQNLERQLEDKNKSLIGQLKKKFVRKSDAASAEVLPGVASASAVLPKPTADYDKVRQLQDQIARLQEAAAKQRVPAGRPAIVTDEATDELLRQLAARLEELKEVNLARNALADALDEANRNLDSRGRELEALSQEVMARPEVEVYQALVDENRGLKAQLDEASRVNGRLRIELGAVNASLHQKEQDLAQLEEKIKTLQAALALKKEGDDSGDDIATQLGALQQKYAAEFKQFQEDKSHLEERLALLNAGLLDAQQNAEMAVKEADRLQKFLVVERERFVAIENELKIRQAADVDRESLIAKIRKEKEEVGKELDALRQAIAGLQGDGVNSALIGDIEEGLGELKETTAKPDTSDKKRSGIREFGKRLLRRAGIIRPSNVVSTEDAEKAKKTQELIETLTARIKLLEDNLRSPVDVDLPADLNSEDKDALVVLRQRLGAVENKYQKRIKELEARVAAGQHDSLSVDSVDPLRDRKGAMYNQLQSLQGHNIPHLEGSNIPLVKASENVNISDGLGGVKTLRFLCELDGIAIDSHQNKIGVGYDEMNRSFVITKRNADGDITLVTLPAEQDNILSWAEDRVGSIIKNMGGEINGLRQDNALLRQHVDHLRALLEEKQKLLGMRGPSDIPSPFAPMTPTVRAGRGVPNFDESIIGGTPDTRGRAPASLSGFGRRSGVSRRSALSDIEEVDTPAASYTSDLGVDLGFDDRPLHFEGSLRPGFRRTLKPFGSDVDDVPVEFTTRRSAVSSALPARIPVASGRRVSGLEESAIHAVEPVAISDGIIDAMDKAMNQAVEMVFRYDQKLADKEVTGAELQAEHEAKRKAFAKTLRSGWEKISKGGYNTAGDILYKTEIQLWNQANWRTLCVSNIDDNNKGGLDFTLIARIYHEIPDTKLLVEELVKLIRKNQDNLESGQLASIPREDAARISEIINGKTTKDGEIPGLKQYVEEHNSIVLNPNELIVVTAFGGVLSGAANGWKDPDDKGITPESYLNFNQFASDKFREASIENPTVTGMIDSAITPVYIDKTIVNADAIIAFTHKIRPPSRPTSPELRPGSSTSARSDGERTVATRLRDGAHVEKGEVVRRNDYREME